MSSERTALLSEEGDKQKYEAIINAEIEGEASSSLEDPDYLIRTSSDSSLLTNPVIPPKGKTSSLITIFAIWNTMMGTSILTMPYAVEQAGLTLGILLMISVMALCLYTAYRVMSLPPTLGVGMDKAEFSDLCGSLLGSWARWTAIIFSIIALLGAVVVYWVLMSNFLFNTGTFIYNSVMNSSFVIVGNATHPDVYCPRPIPARINTTCTNFLIISHVETTFEKIWNLDTTPLFLILIVFPLINFKSGAVFAKLNAWGSVAVLFILTFVSYKAYIWGINVDFQNSSDRNFIPQFKTNFPALTGTLTLAFFIHNCIISIVRNQKNPQHNVRDLTLAYILVCMTYLIVGIVFYISFPLDKLCMEDNLFNNFHASDAFTVAARIFLFIQMLAVLPLIMYVIRSQILHQITPNTTHKLKFILPINVALMSVGILFAIFYPNISSVIRYTGSVSGLVWTFTLPCLTYLVVLYRSDRLTICNLLTHSLIIILGLANFIAQFFVKERDQ